MKSSSFSVRSKITAILMMSTIEKKNVPRNLPIMYRSRRFKGMYYLTIYYLHSLHEAWGDVVFPGLEVAREDMLACFAHEPEVEG